jgi:citrate lyase subunit beta / citryl-CoA lyase
MRSLLFVPGNSAQLILAARESVAEGLVIDLADSVADEQKEQARALVVQLLREVDFGHKQMFVRINLLSTDEGVEDGRTIARSAASGIVIPCAERADDAMVLARLLPQRVSRLLCHIQSPRGVLESRAIAMANPSVTGLIFDAAGVSQALRCTLTEGEPELLFARSQVLMAARMAGVSAHDDSPFALSDVTGLRSQCQRMRNLGYDGLTTHHATHCVVINESFVPSEG